MAIGYLEQNAVDVPTPPIGSQYTFIDTADGMLKRKDDTGLVTVIELAGTGITGLTGEVTATGPGNVAATVSNAAVIAKVLTGFVAGTGVVSSSDSILQAIQKLANGGMLSSNDINYDATIPANHTWLRQNRTRILGTAKITIAAGGKFTILA